MVTRDHLYTVDEFLAFTALPEHADTRFELHDGVIEEIPPSTAANSAIAIAIADFIRDFVRTSKLGFVTGTDGGYRVGTNTMYQPDVAYISRERLPSLKNIHVIPMAPDLAIEIISPSESQPKVTRKVQGYLRDGTKLVWAVYPDEKQVDVYRLTETGDMTIKPVSGDGELDGENVSPDLKIALKAIFEAAE